MSFLRETAGRVRDVVFSPKFYLIIRIVIGLVFIYAGAVKLADPKAFAKVIAQYDMVPEVLLPAFALGLPAIELLAGIGLIFNVRGSLSTIAGLLMVFIMVLGYAVLNDMEVDCGCFSPEEINARNNLRQALIRDLLMIAAAFYMYVYRRIKQSADFPGKNNIHYREETV